MDYRCADGFDAPVCIIYGHNMRNDTMFSPLIRYLDPDFMADHPEIHIITADGEKAVYRIFEARLTDAWDEVYALDAAAITEATATLHGAASVSDATSVSDADASAGTDTGPDTDAGPDAGAGPDAALATDADASRLLVLSTCVDRADQDARLLVFARIMNNL